MQLTSEQQAVLDTNCNVVINAVAGSGRTTTLIAYAKSRSVTSRILYLAFNKTVKTEALQKFAASGINNVKIETAHSLAFDFVVKQSRHKITPGYKSYELCDMLGIKTGDRHANYIVANHVNKFISYFYNRTYQSSAFYCHTGLLKCLFMPMRTSSEMTGVRDHHFEPATDTSNITPLREMRNLMNFLSGIVHLELSFNQHDQKIICNISLLPGESRIKFVILTVADAVTHLGRKVFTPVNNKIINT